MPDRVEVHGAGKPGIDFIEVPTANETMIAALREERIRYQTRLDRGETAYAGEDLVMLIGKVDEQIAYYGASADAAQIVAEVVAEVAPVDPDAPPYEGWVRDRVSGEWRAPKPRGRKPAGDGAQSGSESTPTDEE